MDEGLKELPRRDVALNRVSSCKDVYILARKVGYTLLILDICNTCFIFEDTVKHRWCKYGRILSPPIQHLEFLNPIHSSL